MARYTEAVGQPVRSADGRLIGRLEDLAVSLDEAHPLVSRLIINRTRPTASAAIDWTDVDTFDQHEVTLTVGAAEPHFEGSAAELPLAARELLLGRDVLDTQVVDVRGRRMARVGDVVFGERVDSRPVVAAVEVGFGAVCRRLGLRRLSTRFATAIVDWRDLHLTSARGHRVQLDTAQAAVHRLSGEELAALLSRLSTAAAVGVLAVVPPERAARAIEVSGHETADRVVAAMPADDASQLLEVLPAERAARFRRARHATQPRRRFLRHRRKRGRTP